MIGAIKINLLRVTYQNATFLQWDVTVVFVAFPLIHSLRKVELTRLKRVDLAFRWWTNIPLFVVIIVLNSIIYIYFLSQTNDDS